MAVVVWCLSRWSSVLVLVMMTLSVTARSPPFLAKPSDRSPDGAGEGREGLLEALRRVRLQRRLRRAFAADSVERCPTRGANPFSASKRPAVLQPAGGERQARSNASGEPFFRIEMASCAGPAAASNLRLGSGSLPLGGVGMFGCPFSSEPNQFELLVQSSTSPYSS